MNPFLLIHSTYSVSPAVYCGANMVAGFRSIFNLLCSSVSKLSACYCTTTCRVYLLYARKGLASRGFILSVYGHRLFDLICSSIFRNSIILAPLFSDLGRADIWVDECIGVSISLVTIGNLYAFSENSSLVYFGER